MIEMTDTRTVLVIGRRATAVPALDGSAWIGGAGVCVLTIGWPVSDVQAALVERAIDLAREARVRIEAVLVTSAGEAARYVQPGDDVRLVATARESKRLARSLASVGVTAASF